jgi:hypothetical protein
MSLPENQNSHKKIQLDFFLHEERAQEKIEHEEFKKMVTKSLKGLYARYNELEFQLINLSDEFEDFKKSMLDEVK